MMTIMIMMIIIITIITTIALVIHWVLFTCNMSCAT